LENERATHAATVPLAVDGDVIERRLSASSALVEVDDPIIPGAATATKS
jgi:hypothetical protein